MAHLFRLPRPDDRQAGRAKSRLILAATIALALTGCAIGQRGYPSTLAVVEAGRANDSAHAVLVWTATSPRSGGELARMPILLKDNIETADMPTTAGSLALVANALGRDAPLLARLRG